MTQLPNLWQKVRTRSGDPLTRAREALQQAEQKGIMRMTEPLARALAEADVIGIQLYGKQLEEYLHVVQTVSLAYAALPATTRVEPAPVQPALQPTSLSLPTYVVSPATLASAYTQLTRHLPEGGREPEWMLAVTGVRYELLRTLEHLIEVKLAKQSAVTAAFDMQDFTRIAISLHEQGQALHAIFHSHRFNGPPQPSAVDWRLQEMLDQGGYPTIQAVFSEDGFVRFFAHRPFTVKVSGKGVECVEPKTFLYRVTNFRTLPHSGDSNQHSRRGDAVSPLLAHSGR